MKALIYLSLVAAVTASMFAQEPSPAKVAQPEQTLVAEQPTGGSQQQPQSPTAGPPPQSPPAGQQSQSPAAGQQPQPKPQQQQPPSKKAQRSVLEVKPGGQALKSKDFYERTGYFHPFVRMPEYVAVDQKKIWTSPFHTSKQDLKWWAIFGGATAGLIVADRHIEAQLPNTSEQIHLGQDFSHIGAAYTLVPLGAIFYFAGTAKGSEHFRETGLLTFEALVDTTIVELVLKGATHRERPLEGDGRGRFWNSNASWYNSSFPSGHTINTFAIASVFAHEYHHTNWPVYVAYGFAGLVSAARLAGRNHFPSDVVAGGAMGWFIGDYVYGKRHNTDLDHKPTISQRIMDHVHFGIGVQ